MKHYHPRELAQRAFEAACTKSPIDPVLLDLSDLSTYTDYLLVLGGKSLRQVAAIAEAIELGMKENGHDAMSREGSRGGPWILLDYGDVVIHVFYESVRSYYDLEGLWVEAPRVELVESSASRTGTD